MNLSNRELRILHACLSDALCNAKEYGWTSIDVLQGSGVSMDYTDKASLEELDALEDKLFEAAKNSEI